MIYNKKKSLFFSYPDTNKCLAHMKFSTSCIQPWVMNLTQAESASLNSATGPPYLDKMPDVVGHLGHIWPTQHSF